MGTPELLQNIHHTLKMISGNHEPTEKHIFLVGLGLFLEYPASNLKGCTLPQTNMSSENGGGRGLNS